MQSSPETLPGFARCSTRTASTRTRADCFSSGTRSARRRRSLKSSYRKGRYHSASRGVVMPPAIFRRLTPEARAKLIELLKR